MTRKPPASGSKPIVEYSGGIRIAGTPLWLDAGSAKDLSFVSHAHLDHVARHRTMIATAPTVRFCRDRVGVKDVLTAPCGQPFKLGDLSIELLPAGHILGSAQIRVTLPEGAGGATVGYTGDFSLSPAATVEAAAPLRCDVLIIEATFGVPRYAFPEKEKVMGEITGFIERTQKEGGTPVFLAYPLGKSQELAARLLSAGHRVRAHKAVWENCKAYEDFGVKFPGLHKFVDGARREEVLIFPHRAKSSRMLEKVKDPRFAAVTGWAMDPGAKYKMKVDEAFPLSDHADFEGLLDHVKNAQAKKIYVVHGFVEDFVRTLRAQGHDAAPLKPMERQQLELF